MKKFQHLTVVALVLMTLYLVAILATGAKAEGASKWTGCYGGATIGTAMTKTELSAFGASIDGLGGDGVTAGINGGCDIQFERFLIGAFAQYQWTDADFKLATGGGSFTAGLNEAWAVGGRAGVLITPRTLAYGLLGYTEAKASSNLVTVPNLKGYLIGGGMETLITTNVSLKLEYQYSKFDASNIGPVTIEPVNHAVLFGVAYRFGDVPTLPK